MHLTYDDKDRLWSKTFAYSSGNTPRKTCKMHDIMIGIEGEVAFFHHEIILLCRQSFVCYQSFVCRQHYTHINTCVQAKWSNSYVGTSDAGTLVQPPEWFLDIPDIMFGVNRRNSFHHKTDSLYNGCTEKQFLVFTVPNWNWSAIFMHVIFYSRT